MNRLNIDFGKVMTNALSALVATVFVGAAAIVWTNATSIDERIETARDNIEKQQDQLKDQQANLQATQEEILPELAEIKNRTKELAAKLENLNKMLAETEAFGSAMNGSMETGAGREAIPKLNEKEEAERLKGRIDRRQMQILRKPDG